MLRLLIMPVALLLASCGPVTFSATVGRIEPRLGETAVIIDDRPAGKVALIEVRGVLIDADKPGLLGDGSNPVDELVAALDRAAEDDGVKAVVLRIDSPGGSVTASDVMYHEVVRFRQATGKPVVAALATVAASGGYYLALAADEIVAEPTCITGSIGVIFPTFNVSEAFDRWGIRSRAVVSRPNKDIASPFEPIEEQHYAILQSMVDEQYARFRSLVVERRPALATGRLDEATDGRIMTGQQAIHLGLADSAGGVREAFDAAKALAGITGARLVRYHGRWETARSPYASVSAPGGRTGALAGDMADPGVLELRIPMLERLDLEPGAYYLWMP